MTVTTGGLKRSWVGSSTSAAASSTSSTRAISTSNPSVAATRLIRSGLRFWFTVAMIPIFISFLMISLGLVASFSQSSFTVIVSGILTTLGGGGLTGGVTSGGLGGAAGGTTVGFAAAGGGRSATGAGFGATGGFFSVIGGLFSATGAGFSATGGAGRGASTRGRSGCTRGAGGASRFGAGGGGSRLGGGGGGPGGCWSGRGLGRYYPLLLGNGRRYHRFLASLLLGGNGFRLRPHLGRGLGRGGGGLRRHRGLRAQLRLDNLFNPLRWLGLGRHLRLRHPLGPLFLGGCSLGQCSPSPSLVHRATGARHRESALGQAFGDLLAGQAELLRQFIHPYLITHASHLPSPAWEAPPTAGGSPPGEKIPPTGPPRLSASAWNAAPGPGKASRLEKTSRSPPRSRVSATVLTPVTTLLVLRATPRIRVIRWRTA